MWGPRRQNPAWGPPRPQPGWGPSPNLGYPPPQRSGGVGNAILIGVLVLLLGGGAAVVILGLRVADELADLPVTTSTTATQPPTPTPTTRQPSTTTTTQPPTTTRPPTSRPPTRRPTQTYQNDNYRVPNINRNPGEAPRPWTTSEARSAIRSNPMYSRRIPIPVRCQPGAFPQTRSKAALTPYTNAWSACLMRVWAVPLAQAGYNLHRPMYTHVTGRFRNKCGVHDNQTHYCPADQQIYMSTVTWNDRADFQYVVIHEFMHLVQHRLGILTGSWYFEYYARTNTEKDEWSRRLELQADCFTGITINSLTQSLQLDGPARQSYAERRAQRGSPRHGYGRPGRIWLTRGMDTTSVNRCNTYVVPSSEVPVR